ncbi:MAG: DUF1361 domain-containing protein, partial [Candidatus Levybacteria bacterium]|nr:DUF1361 domain-containing protein [Candidatus Levybacteria bacterium]
MEIFIDNFNYMLLNSFLALIAVIFGWLMLQKYPRFLQLLFGILWLIFLPNTIYILTDISHLIEDWQRLDDLFKIIVTIQYLIFSIFGIITFIFSTYFFQQLLEGKTPGWRIKHSRFSALFAIFILNFIVGFGVILGGIQ